VPAAVKTKCVECGGFVSSQALRCPHCGGVPILGACYICGQTMKFSEMPTTEERAKVGFHCQAIAHMSCIVSVGSETFSCPVCSREFSIGRFHQDSGSFYGCPGCGDPLSAIVGQGCYCCGMNVPQGTGVEITAHYRDGQSNHVTSNPLLRPLHESCLAGAIASSTMNRLMTDPPHSLMQVKAHYVRTRSVRLLWSKPPWWRFW